MQIDKNVHDHKTGLNAFRKDATAKTKDINKHIFENIDWQRLEIEKELAKCNSVYDTPFPVVPREGSFIPIWDLKKYEFLFKQNIPATVNPKLWEQGKLNLNSGIYKITENIYQVRGYDLANMSFIKGKTGWIIIGCLTSQETAEAAIKLVQEHLIDMPVSAIIITHSHVDHYGGVLGALNYASSEDVKVYVPRGFLEAVIEENINAGIAMSRRGLYMYGETLPRDAKGQIDCGIGKYPSFGTMTLTENVVQVGSVYALECIDKEIDGVLMRFHLTPSTEAPTEFNIYIPSENSLCIAELCSATLHNVYTLRGAEVRDPVAWAKYIQESIDLFGSTLTSVFCVHNWPRFGNKYCLDYLAKQRDLYQYMNDQTLRLINKGYTINDIEDMVKFPDSLSKEWYNSPFYGTVKHNVKAICQKYIGWYTGDPVDLNILPARESAKRYVEYMGGEDNVIHKAKKEFEYGEYQWVAEVTRKVIYANPKNRAAKLLCADALEQLGYIAESGPWRNEYLMGAWELRYGKFPMPGSTVQKNVLDAMPLSKVLYLLSIRVIGLVAGNFNFKINFIIPDRKEIASTELKRGIFRFLCNELDSEAEVTVTMSSETLYELATTNNEIKPSDINVEGDKEKWREFLCSQDRLDQDFNIMTCVIEK